MSNLDAKRDRLGRDISTLADTLGKAREQNDDRPATLRQVIALQGATLATMADVLGTLADDHAALRSQFEGLQAQLDQRTGSQ